MVAALRDVNGRYVGNRPVRLKKSNWKEKQNTGRVVGWQTHRWWWWWFKILGFGVGLGFQIDIIYAVTNRRLKGSKGFQRLDSYFKVGWVFPGEPSHDIPCLLLQKWTRYCCFHYHIQPPSGPFMSTLSDMCFFGETRLSKWSVAAGSWPFLVHKTPRSSPGPTITGAIWGYTMNWIAVRDHVSHVSQSIAMPWANGLTGQGYWLWEERSIVAARCLVECTSAASERNLSRLEPIRNISETLWCRFTKRILVCAYKDRNLQEMYE